MPKKVEKKAVDTSRLDAVASEWLGKPLRLCNGVETDIEWALKIARDKVTGQAGNTLIMTLPTGRNVVRFMFYTQPLAADPGPNIGKFSEGTDMNMGTALAAAIAGLSM